MYVQVRPTWYSMYDPHIENSVMMCRSTAIITRNATHLYVVPAVCPTIIVLEFVASTFHRSPSSKNAFSHGLNNYVGQVGSKLAGTNFPIQENT